MRFDCAGCGLQWLGCIDALLADPQHNPHLFGHAYNAVAADVKAPLAQLVLNGHVRNRERLCIVDIMQGPTGSTWALDPLAGTGGVIPATMVLIILCVVTDELHDPKASRELLNGNLKGPHTPAETDQKDDSKNEAKLPHRCGGDLVETHWVAGGFATPCGGHFVGRCCFVLGGDV